MKKRMMRQLLYATFLCFSTLQQTCTASMPNTRSDLSINTTMNEHDLNNNDHLAQQESCISRLESNKVNDIEKLALELSLENGKETAIKGNPAQWTFLVYMAARNNLCSFAQQNLRQMAQVGSNANINIVVHYDGIGERNIKRFLIQKGNIQLLSELAPEVDTISGTPQSLYKFIQWGVKNFPSDYVAIDCWNHGSGCKDPCIWGRFLMKYRDDLFTLNTDTSLFELNRQLANQEELFSIDSRSLLGDFATRFFKERGIAFNDTEEQYITNQELKAVMDNVCRYVLNKKIDIVFMDACHMGMVEFASKLSPYVNYMVASSEVEPGAGYDYEKVLSNFRSGGMTPREFAIQGVKAYEQKYKGSYGDYTQSAVELENFNKVEQGFFNLGRTLFTALNHQDPRRVTDILKVTRLSSKYTTEFYDPDYIDAGHLCLSLMEKSQEVLDLHANTLLPEHRDHIEAIKQYSGQIYSALREVIVAETHGPNIPMSHGLGLFFPKRTVHSSYLNTTFDKKTMWSKFLGNFIQKIKMSRAEPTTR